jgi:hypothetical protein
MREREWVGYFPLKSNYPIKTPTPYGLGEVRRFTQAKHIFHLWPFWRTSRHSQPAIFYLLKHPKTQFNTKPKPRLTTIIQPIRSRSNGHKHRNPVKNKSIKAILPRPRNQEHGKARNTRKTIPSPATSHCEERVTHCLHPTRVLSYPLNWTIHSCTSLFLTL